MICQLRSLAQPARLFLSLFPRRLKPFTTATSTSNVPRSLRASFCAPTRRTGEGRDPNGGEGQARPPPVATKDTHSKKSSRNDSTKSSLTPPPFCKASSSVGQGLVSREKSLHADLLSGGNRARDERGDPGHDTKEAHRSETKQQTAYHHKQGQKSRTPIDG